MIKVGSLNRSIGSKSKIGCVLGLDFKHLDGASFMSNRDCYGHLGGTAAITIFAQLDFLVVPSGLIASLV